MTQIENVRTVGRRDWLHTRPPPSPTASAIEGAPLAASKGRAMATATRARQVRNGAADNP